MMLLAIFFQQLFYFEGKVVTVFNSCVAFDLSSMLLTLTGARICCQFLSIGCDWILAVAALWSFSQYFYFLGRVFFVCLEEHGHQLFVK